ncbi:GNAT family N-acetyltransferase [Novosphingobium sp. ZN18A2]|uniref:GNAT family N-acetyltransferase n=1 Tax=Novosphingobium sp. ZN18A2 TaxID=3079861 RepID=UPI0030D56FC0
MDGLTITHFDQGARGEYHARLEGHHAIGRLTYQRKGEVLVADHTIVPREIGGRGVAAELVKALVADARDSGWKIDPQCSYVAALFKRHPEWADLHA